MTTSLGGEKAGLYASRASRMRCVLCVLTFSLSLGVGVGLAEACDCDCGTPWKF